MIRLPRTTTLRKILTGIAATALTVTIWQACDDSTGPTVSVPTLTTQPTAQTVNAGNPLTISVTADGGGTFTYKWVHSYTWESANAGEDAIAHVDTLKTNSATYTVTASPFDAGNYKCIVSNSAGSVTSSSVSVSVTAAASLPSALLTIGADVAKTTCAGCHHYPPAGDGGGGYPPLIHSDYLMANKERSIRILLLGLGDSGTAAVNPVIVNGESYNGSMPGVGAGLTDSAVAGALTYMRATFNGSTTIVTPAEVQHQRDSLTTAGKL